MKSYFKLLLLFTAFFYCICAAHAVSFAVVSDSLIQTGNPNDKNKGLTPTINTLLHTVKQINSLDPDYVVFLGNNTAKADKMQLVMFAKIVNRIKKPIYTVVGNKDVAQLLDLDKKEYFKFLNRFSHNKTHKLPYSKCLPNGLVMIFMDGVNQYIPNSRGYYKDEELIWLENQLNKYSAKKVVIFQHFPVVPPQEDENGRPIKIVEYEKLLARHNNVIAIVSGHYQIENEIEKNGILHISVPGLAAGGTFKEIVIDKDGIVNTKIHDIN